MEYWMKVDGDIFKDKQRYLKKVVELESKR